MSNLTEAEVLALAKASNVNIPQELLREVTISLNSLLEAVDNIDIPGLNKVEPLPIILPMAQPPTS